MCRSKSSGSVVHSKESRKRLGGCEQNQIGKPGTIYVTQDPAQLHKIKILIH